MSRNGESTRCYTEPKSETRAACRSLRSAYATWTWCAGARSSARTANASWIIWPLNGKPCRKGSGPHPKLRLISRRRFGRLGIKWATCWKVVSSIASCAQQKTSCLSWTSGWVPVDGGEREHVWIAGGEVLSRPDFEEERAREWTGAKGRVWKCAKTARQKPIKRRARVQAESPCARWRARTAVEHSFPYSFVCATRKRVN